MAPLAPKSLRHDLIDLNVIFLASPDAKMKITLSRSHALTLSRSHAFTLLPLTSYSLTLPPNLSIIQFRLIVTFFLTGAQ